MEVKKMMKEENENFVKHILSPLLKLIDLAVDSYEMPRLLKTYESMKNQLRTLEAFPFPKTLNKSDIVKVQNKIFKGVLDLIELRIKQKGITIKQALELKEGDILKQLGF